MKRVNGMRLKSKNKKEPKPVCGLCGRSNKEIIKTGCCGNWICDDESEYKLFSYARNSCSRNHRRFTLCSHHHIEEHKGNWQACKKCLKDWSHELEMYVWYGTNEYNFEKLKNPPEYDPTLCNTCGKLIILGDGGYSSFKGKYDCFVCSQMHRSIQDALSSKQEPRTLTRSDKDEIIKKQKEIEKDIKALLKKTKSKFTLNDVKKIIHNEKETGEFQDLIMMFDDGDPDNLSNVLELITDAWNYFPHKILDNKCPQEKLLKYQN